MTVVEAQPVPARRLSRRMRPLLVWLLAPAFGLLGSWLWRTQRLPARAPSGPVMAATPDNLPLDRSLRTTAGSMVVLSADSTVPATGGAVTPVLVAKPRQPEPVHEDLQHPPLPWPLDGALALGGTISRDSALEPPVPAMVQAERLLQQRSGDPLYALPPSLRQPFRRVLTQLPQHPGVRPARVVVLPVAKLQRPIEVPLLLHPSGEIDVFAEPMTRVAAAAMEQWLNRLDAPSAREVQPLLLRLLPMPAGHAGPLAAPES
jgi:hypothetical protein